MRIKRTNDKSEEWRLSDGYSEITSATTGCEWNHSIVQTARLEDPT